jgi:hypothetical protein
LFDTVRYIKFYVNIDGTVVASTPKPIGQGGAPSQSVRVPLSARWSNGRSYLDRNFQTAYSMLLSSMDNTLVKA